MTTKQGVLNVKELFKSNGSLFSELKRDCLKFLVAMKLKQCILEQAVENQDCQRFMKETDVTFSLEDTAIIKIIKFPSKAICFECFVNWFETIYFSLKIKQVTVNGMRYYERYDTICHSFIEILNFHKLLFSN